MRLEYNNQVRQESNQEVIDNLLRKGWVITEDPVIVEPVIDESTQKMIDFAAEIDKGFLVQPEGFVIRLQDGDRNLFSQMVTLVQEALALGLISNDTPQAINDQNGEPKQISTLRFRQIMVEYGFFYKNLWDRFNS